MKKKLFSLALALTMCVGLAVPAMAVEDAGADTAGQAGGSSFSDVNGTYSVSNPILYTAFREDVKGIDMSGMEISVEDMPYDEGTFGPAADYLEQCFWSRMETVYALPEGTVVTLPDNVLTATVFELDVTWENGVGHATEFNVINYPGFTSVALDGSGYILGVELEYLDAGTDETQSGVSGSEIGGNIAGVVYFYVPADGTENPFAASEEPTEPAEPTDPAEPTEPADPVEIAFTDVAADAYYAQPVLWAVQNGITNGTSDYTFSPDQTCTRAQILTFMWQANGAPEAAIDNPFTDLQPGVYYYKPALWAAEKGLISGEVFAADTDCTRAATMEYLWKLAGSPAPASQAEFADVAADAPYAQAVSWAVESKVTSGTGDGAFSPDQTCTRGQIMTFLYLTVER